MALSNVDKLKKRMLDIKNRLPNGYRKLFLEKYPSYNNNKGRVKLSNVVQLRTVDKDILEKLEKITLK